MQSALLCHLPVELLDLVVVELPTRDLLRLLLTTKVVSERYRDALLEKGMEESGKPVIWAAANGDAALVTRILDMEEKRRKRGARRWTACYDNAVAGAVKRDDIGIVRMLLPWLPRPIVYTDADKIGTQLLLEASKRGNVDVLRALFESKRVDPNMRVKCNGQTPLHVCASMGHTDAAYMLQELGVDLRVADREGDTPARAAAMGGHVGILDMLAAQDPALVLEACARGYTPLHAAAQRGHLEAMRKLLAWGADPMAAAERGRMAIDSAVAGEKPAAIELLLEHPAVARTLNDPRDNDTTVLSWAVQNSLSLEVVRALLRGGADLAATRSTAPYTSMLSHALMEAECHWYHSTDDQADVVGELLRAGADPNRREREPVRIDQLGLGRAAVSTPLAVAAACSGDGRVIRYLLSLGGLVDWHAGVHVDTAPLACALRGGHLEAVYRLVLVAGLSPNAVYRVHEDHSVWEPDPARDCGPAPFIALAYKHTVVFWWLLRSGRVDLAARDADGRSLMQAALRLPQDAPSSKHRRLALMALAEAGFVPTESEVRVLGGWAGNRCRYPL